jgi:hypothetical protein
MNKEMQAIITLRLIEEIPIPRNKFPCFCIPTNFGYPENPHIPKYKWEHAGIVESLVRTAADYFEIIEAKPIDNE